MRGHLEISTALNGLFWPAERKLSVGSCPQAVRTNMSLARFAGASTLITRRCGRSPLCSPPSIIHHRAHLCYRLQLTPIVFFTHRSLVLSLITPSKCSGYLTFSSAVSTGSQSRLWFVRSQTLVQNSNSARNTCVVSPASSDACN